MGYYNSVYVGVFIEAPLIKAQTEIKVFRKPSGKISKTRFNPETGEEYIEDIIIKDITETPVPYIDDNDSLNEDEFYIPGYTDTNVFLCNVDSKYRFCDDSDIFVLSLENINMNELINDFKVEYKEYLDYYKNKYPECDFKVKFGVICYTN